MGGGRGYAELKQHIPGQRPGEIFGREADKKFSAVSWVMGGDMRNSK